MRKIKSLAPEDLAWVAGVLDFKGVVIRKKNKMRSTPQLVLYVETKNYGVIQALSELTGTKPELKDQKTLKDWMRRGCAEHCPEKHVHGNEMDAKWRMPLIGRWTSTGAAAATILWNTVPLMRTDRGLRDAMELMLDQSVTTGQGWGATRSALRRLRDLGWDLPPRYDDLDSDG